MTLISYEDIGLTAEEEEIVGAMVSSLSDSSSDLEGMWALMDEVWDKLGCDNRNLDWEVIGKFYAHPVWLLNGLFTESDPESLHHRQIMSDWLVQHAPEMNIKKVIDYGGGFGVFGRFLAEKAPDLDIEVFEPHPTRLALEKSSKFKNLKFIDALSGNYDALIAIDVMEHLEDPLDILHQLSNTVRKDGILIFANCFYPVIKCHLPHTFYLKYFFRYFARQFGLKKIGSCSGSHAIVYQKRTVVRPNWKKIRVLEFCCQRTFLLLDRLVTIIQKVKKGLRCA